LETDFFLSMSGISLLSAFSTITGILSLYFSLIRLASACLLSEIHAQEEQDFGYYELTKRLKHL
jgi:hypothetical protein